MDDKLDSVLPQDPAAFAPLPWPFDAGTGRYTMPALAPTSSLSMLAVSPRRSRGAQIRLFWSPLALVGDSVAAAFLATSSR